VKARNTLIGILITTALALGMGPAPAQASPQPTIEPLTLEEVQADPSIKLVAIETVMGTQLVLPDQKADPVRVGTQNIYANPNRILCSYTGGLIRTYDWSAKDPRTCGGTYRVYYNNKLVFQHAATNGPGLWGIISQGYAAVERWCQSNSAACGIITGIGVTIVTRRLGL